MLAAVENALPPKPPRTRLSPDQRRAQLVDHAIACFAEHGIARATQAQIAARAGVSVSAVYSYFRTRPDLVAAVLDTVAATIAAMVTAAIAAPGPPAQRLSYLARETADMADSAPDTVRVWLDWSSGVRADVWPQFLVLQSRLQDLVEAVLAGSDSARTPVTRSAARLFVGGAHTLALMRFADVDAAAQQLFIDQMVAGVMAVTAPVAAAPHCP